LLLAFALITTIWACKKFNRSNNIETVSDNPVINKFLNSNEYLKNKVLISSYGEIDFTQSKTDSIKHKNKIFNVIYLTIVKDNKVQAGVEIVDLSGKKLSDGDSYAINLLELKHFDIKSTTGNIKMYDLNKNAFMHSDITITNNRINSWKTFPINKVKLASYIPTSNNYIFARKSTNICDLNKNGDVSFSECYKCLNDTIDTDGFSKWVCDTPVVGWASCYISVTAACVVISMWWSPEPEPDPLTPIDSLEAPIEP
jgi:hypothetical protein